MVSVLVGPNRFALQKSLQQARSDFAQKHGELAIESLDAEEVELQKIQEALQSISLFTPTKMVIVRSLSNNKQAADGIENILETTPEETTLLIVEPKVDKRSSYYKTLKKQTTMQEFSELDEFLLVKWAVEEAKAGGVQISHSDAQYLVNRVGSEQGRLYTELQKLINYDHTIDRAVIDLLTEGNPQNTIFELLEAAFGGRLPRTMQLYDNLLASGSQPPMIIGMIAWQMHLVALVAFAGTKSVEQISADSGAKPYTLQKSQQIANNLNTKKIKELLRGLKFLDCQIKTESIDPGEATRNFLSRLATS